MFAIFFTPNSRWEIDEVYSRYEELSWEKMKGKNGAHSFTNEFSIPLCSVMTPESAAFETILRHRRLILEAIQQRAELKCLASEEERLAETVKEVWWG